MSDDRSMPTAQVIEQASLRRGPGAGLFEGADFGGVAVSFFMVDSEPGQGPALHVHPYDEVFLLHDGEATFTVGGETTVARGGQIVLGPAEVPHKFENTGQGRLRMTTIHPRGRTEQRWLE
jgi:mannose-6-phosphate isomerase-like protein (cupin superfamily)